MHLLYRAAYDFCGEATEGLHLRAYYPAEEHCQQLAGPKA